MDDGYALLRAIEADPDEDTPRLAYADWLDEHAATDADRARAEFIRVQCELARVATDDERRAALNVREREAVAPWCSVWADQLPVKLSGMRFERGFFTPLRFDAADWFRAADGIAALAPLIELELRSSTNPVRKDAARSCPALQLVRRLNASGRRLVTSLVRVGRLQNLFALDVSASDLDSDECESLAATSFPNLRRLAMTRNLIADRGLEALRHAAWFGQLESLALDHCGVSDGSLVAFVSHPHAANLRRLTLGPFANSDEVARALIASPHLSRIDSLHLRHDGTSEQMRTELGVRFAGNVVIHSLRLG